MKEYGGKAVILNRESAGEADSVITLLTEQHGKLIARAKSARKIVSKLSAHLEPGSVSLVRLVEQKGLRVADALQESRVAIHPNHLRIIGELLGEAHQDEGVWDILSAAAPFSWAAVLTALGWDPQGARCQECARAEKLEYFMLRTQEFMCRNCVATFRPRGEEVIYIG